MVTVTLTQGKVAVIDDDDANIIKPFKWCASHQRSRWYAMSYVPGSKKEGKARFVYMHKIIMGYGNGKEIDHINHDGLDNTRKNLRFVTRSQNNWNARIQTRNKSGYRGVFFLKNAKKNPWWAKLLVNGIPVFSGYFPTSIEAAKAYNEASLKHHGEWGYRNLIPE